jgi:hypothetical protein
MSVLTISGNTLQKMDWDVESILKVESKEDTITRLTIEDWKSKVSTCGLTYGEIEELDLFNY